jgi:hypothetical protein
VPAAVCMLQMASITSVLASKGSASPSKSGSMVDVKRYTRKMERRIEWQERN